LRTVRRRAKRRTKKGSKLMKSLPEGSSTTDAGSSLKKESSNTEGLPCWTRRRVVALRKKMKKET